MTLAIMQPYIFPYLGYFQLINAVDKFVFYDDVNFIKKGWINRNNILMNGKSSPFTIPLHKVSQNRLICETNISKESRWRDQFLKTIKHSYSKAPYFSPCFDLIEKTIGEEVELISELAIRSVQNAFDYLAIPKVFEKSSQKYSASRTIKGADRLIKICQINAFNHYINPAGGIDLYDKNYFQDNKVQLQFISTQTINYQQFNNDFVPGLSIIDAMMFNSPSEIVKMLDLYRLT